MNQFRNEIFSGQPIEEQLLGTKRPRSRGATALSDVAVKRAEARRADSRGGDRHRLAAQSLTVLYKRKKYTVDLINLSGGGAMIEGPLSPKLWDRIDVDFGTTGRLEAAVRWVKDGRIGLEFAHETQIDCPAEEQEALLREVLDRSFSEAAAPAPEPASPVADSECELTSRRVAPRHPLIWSGSVVINGQRASVRIRNISARGALVQSDVTMSPGVLLVLDLGAAGSIAANVAWAFGDKAGLLFDSEFDVQKLAASTPKVAPIEWVCPDFLRSSSNGSDKAWDRASVEELANSLAACRKR